MFRATLVSNGNRLQGEEERGTSKLFMLKSNSRNYSSGEVDVFRSAGDHSMLDAHSNAELIYCFSFDSGLSGRKKTTVLS